MKALLVHENLVCELIETKDTDVRFQGETLIHMTTESAAVYMRNVHGLNVTHDETDVSNFRFSFYVHPGVKTRYPMISKNDLAFIALAFWAASTDAESEVITHRQLSGDELRSVQVYEQANEDENDEDEDENDEDEDDNG